MHVLELQQPGTVDLGDAKVLVHKRFPLEMSTSEARTDYNLSGFIAVDILQVTGLLLEYQQRFQIAPIFSEEEVRHYFLPVPDVIDTYIVERKGKHFLLLRLSVALFRCAAEIDALQDCPASL